MKTTSHFNGTDNLELSITVTMPLRDWKTLRSELPTDWPAWKLASAIQEAVRKAEANLVFTDDAL